MKKNLASLIVLILFCSIYGTSNAQLPNQGTYLLRNLNQHASPTLYSAIWGYQAPDGRQYAMLGCPTGTAFIDVTDSANIHEVDFLPGSNSAWREMKTYSHYAYIVSEASNSQVQIVDLQYLPDSVRYVKKWGAPGHSSTHSISQSGTYLYLNGANSSFVGNGGIAVLDLSTDTETPVLRGKWTDYYVHDCRVINDTIYSANIFDENVSIINATNKNTLNSITTFVNLPNSVPHNTALTNNRKRLFVTDEIGSAPYRLKVWNIEDKSNITFVTAWQPTGITNSISHNIEIYDNIAIVAHYSAGIRILNITNPDVPTEIAWYDTYPSNNNESYNGCWGVYMFNDGKIIASDRQTGLYVIKTNFPITGTGTGGNHTNSVPETYKLEQNVPNPFNPTTSIKFSLPNSSQISLKVFDINGKMVADVINERREAGDYEISFDANNYRLSSGVYFYSLKSEGFLESKKMILIK